MGSRVKELEIQKKSLTLRDLFEFVEHRVHP